MTTRRTLLRAGALSAAAMAVPLPGLRLTAAPAPGVLDPESIPKYVTPLLIPPAMPTTSTFGGVDQYVIGVRQFDQQILPAGLPATTVWGYGSTAHPDTFHSPAFTIEANVARPVEVTWVNALVDGSGRYLPHLLPVDPTLHWANPPGGVRGRDRRPSFTTTPGRYTGPVPIVTHVHGAHATEESDGYPEAWYLPAARDIPPAYARVGSLYERFRATAAARWHTPWLPGTAVFRYRNDQRAATLWYHDHALGITRLNVYAGPAGFYLLRGGPGDLPDGVLPGPAPMPGDPAGLRYREIPVAIQDRSFRTDGSLFYPDSRAFFDGYGGPYIPTTDVSPIWNPEFFGDTMMVNGRTWPVHEVEPCRYRLRLLNGCGSRFLVLKLVTDPLAARPASPVLPFWAIGGDGGFLPAPVRLDQLLMGNAERMDVVVDFTGLPEGTAVYLINEGPDEPFGGGEPPGDFDAADPETTGQVMKFVVGPPGRPDSSVPPADLVLPAHPGQPPESRVRRLSLNEVMSSVIDGPIMAMLGTVDGGGQPNPLGWADPVTEDPALGSTELWELHNFTVDAHPVHLHQVQFQVVGRQPFGGPAQPPRPWESGPKDTVIALPGQVTRLRATFDLAGLYVWHCHILEHEDNEMMRPLRVR
jgi:spore coat protein A